MLRFFLYFLVVGVPAIAGPSAAEIARKIQTAGLDSAESYRVVDFPFSKQDVRIYLNAGYLVFTKPVNGLRTGAVFIADAEGGDAEVLLLPPRRSERLSLASFTDSPNLDEHFRSALM
ncbi:MAG: hypothetical protein JO022_07890, partial [Acidobacteriaceae bacterium]|nr:hypothetical protein [Acidobacteriaceae bacterium]